VIIESLQYLVKEERVIIYGYVIMDNHIHLIWKPTLLFSLKHTQLSFMKFTAQRIKKDLEMHHPDVLRHFMVEAKDRAYQFWKRNSLCVDLYSDVIIEEKLGYIHRNPAKGGLLVENTNNGLENTNNGTGYRFSSAGFYMGMGDEFGILRDYRW
jgi:REP element-mobilizing transposase RayT